MDILNFTNLIVRVVDPVETRWWLEVQHIGDLVLRRVQSHQMLQSRETLEVLKTVAGNVDVLEVLELIDSVEVRETLFVDGQREERMARIVESLAHVSETLAENDGVFAIEGSNLARRRYRHSFCYPFDFHNFCVHVVLGGNFQNVRLKCFP